MQASPYAPRLTAPLTLTLMGPPLTLTLMATPPSPSPPNPTLTLMGHPLPVRGEVRAPPQRLRPPIVGAASPLPRAPLTSSCSSRAEGAERQSERGGARVEEEGGG